MFFKSLVKIKTLIWLLTIWFFSQLVFWWVHALLHKFKCSYRVYLIYLLCIRSLMMSPRWCLSSPHSPHITCSSCHKNIKIFQAKEIECQKCRKFPVTVMREQEFKVNIHWETLQTFNIVPQECAPVYNEECDTKYEQHCKVEKISFN